MTKKPFIAHSEITDEIYIVCGAEKYLVTEQVIKAMQNTGRLKQPTSDDCVSRAEVDQRIYDYAESNGLSYANMKNYILDVPPVTPTHKVGKWIYDKAIQNWRCSVCNKTPKTMGFCGTADFMEKEFTFCNHCGAEMVGSENG